MNIIIANNNPVYNQIENILQDQMAVEVIRLKEELNTNFLAERKPDYIFFLHWSFLIPESIYSNYNCIVFHMTDLPYGRGGSPLQNLIVKGHSNTMLSAIKVEKGLDTGPVYLKSPLPLYGTAEEIFLRAGGVMLEMIAHIVKEEPTPVPQEGEPVIFTRRKPAESNIKDLNELEEVFDYIRMLDAEGYPKAFIETGSLRIEFTRAARKKDSIIADVRITKK